MPQLRSLHRTAFVTGASAGLGRAYAEMLLAEGLAVWGTSRDTARLAPLAAAHPGSFHPVALDLDDAPAASAAFARASAESGGFDLVINNAGYGAFAPFATADFSLWQAQLNALLTTTARLTHDALRGMLAKNSGCLVNASSVAADFPLPYMAAYNAAKAGLSALTESLVFETRGTGVTVIDFRPGDYRTDFNDAMRKPAPTSAAAHVAADSRPSRLARAWRTLEANLRAAPPPAHAAAALRTALLRRRSGTVRCGSFFQAQLAPFLVRFSPSNLRRALMARYFGIH